MRFAPEPPVDPTAHTAAPRTWRSTAISLSSSLHGSSYRPDIDGLRAISVLAVVAYHAAPDWVHGGFVGVDVFFVISGFLISSVIFGDIRRNRFSFYQFYARRIRRIFPALGLMLVAVWLIGWFLLLPEEFQRLGRDIIAAACFASNIVFWHDVGYFDQSAQLKPLLHLWSLGVEEQYYIIWPLAVFLASKVRRGLPLVMTVAAIASFAANVAAPQSADAFYLPYDRFWELLAGGGLAYAIVFHRFDDAVRFRNTLAVVALTLLGIAVFCLDNTMRFPGWWTLLPVAAGVMLIVAGPSAWPNRFILSNPPMVLIGLISYPLYLWHWPLLSLGRIISPDPLAGSTIAGLMAVGFALAWLTYSLVELPVRLPRKRLPATKIAPVLVISMMAIGVTGACTFARGGFPARFPAIFGARNIASDALLAYRQHVCFMDGGLSVPKFADECVDTAVSNSAPLLFLWGDSHAAHLYPGLHYLQNRRNFRIAQYTTSGCPPYLGWDILNIPPCRQTNQDTLQRITELKPDWVILSGHWAGYPLPPLALDDTIKALRGIGIKNILIVGPNPTWNPIDFTRLLFDYYRQDGSVPWRIDFEAGLPRNLDRDMRERAERFGIGYISLIDALCNEEGCLTRVGDRPNDIMFMDRDHLSVAGSRYIAKYCLKSSLDLP
jgi:peptidoglycan/LPS O-acetylase OafA/YrhL